jgi:hypothetical protein
MFIFVEIVTTMTDQLTDLETQVFEKIKGARMNTFYGLAIQSVIENPTVSRIRKLIAEFIEQARDNPGHMYDALNFDLPNMFKVNLYTPERLNEELRFFGFAYRAVRIVPYTDKDAVWCAPAGCFVVEGCAATTYVDSNLKRYIKLGNGQLFECTNTDLSSLSERGKADIIDHLTGLIY